jgi:superfamily II DNA or RNA helicase
MLKKELVGIKSTNMDEERSKKQEEVVQHYIDSAMLRSTLVLGTGFGKSKVVIEIIKREKPMKVCILVNSTDLRDNNWKEEFEKWGMGVYYEENVLMSTYQAAYKWTPETMDLDGYFIIADEVDFAGGTEEYSKFFDNYPMNKTLGVTGYVTKDKKVWFDIFMPITYVYSTEDAQEADLLNQVHFKFVKYELSREKTLRVDYKDKKTGDMKYFMTSESSAYDHGHKKFMALVKEQEQLRRSKGDYSEEEYTKVYDKLQAQIRFAISNRNKILLNSDTSADIAKAIVKQELEQVNNKIVTFSVLTDQSKKITGNVYNGKEKESVNKEIFSNFNSSKIRVLGVCSKVNRGVNFTGLNTAVFETFYSSDTDMQLCAATLLQKEGRGRMATRRNSASQVGEKGSERYQRSERTKYSNR